VTGARMNSDWSLKQPVNAISMESTNHNILAIKYVAAPGAIAARRVQSAVDKLRADDLLPLHM